jgi:hypothetical protein
MIKVLLILPTLSGLEKDRRLLPRALPWAETSERLRRCYLLKRVLFEIWVAHLIFHILAGVKERSETLAADGLPKILLGT